MAAILEAGTQLAPAGVVSSSTDFPPLPLNPRTLPTCHWVLAVTVPPVASATFRLQVASTSGGTYSTMATLVWPSGTAGTKQLRVGVSGHLAWILNTTSVWIRASVTTTGAFTLAGSCQFLAQNTHPYTPLEKGRKALLEHLS